MTRLPCTPLSSPTYALVLLLLGSLGYGQGCASSHEPYTEAAPSPDAARPFEPETKPDSSDGRLRVVNGTTGMVEFTVAGEHESWVRTVEAHAALAAPLAHGAHTATLSAETEPQQVSFELLPGDIGITLMALEDADTTRIVMWVDESVSRPCQVDVAKPNSDCGGGMRVVHGAHDISSITISTEPATEMQTISPFDISDPVYFVPGAASLVVKHDAGEIGRWDSIRDQNLPDLLLVLPAFSDSEGYYLAGLLPSAQLVAFLSLDR